jgi:iron complex transport system substrate-binding protein
MERLIRADELTNIVINCGLALHRQIGPGLIESVYEQVLADRLRALGLIIDRQQPVEIIIDGKVYPDAFRYDLLVENLLLIELKSIEKLGPIHVKQTLTYVRLMNLPIGLLLNFGSETFKQGIRRVTNNHWKA